MLGIERLCGTLVGGLRHQLVPPVIAAGRHVDRRLGALVDDDMLHGGAGLERFFDDGEQLDLGAAPVRSVLRDHGDGMRIVNAIDQRI